MLPKQRNNTKIRGCRQSTFTASLKARRSNRKRYGHPGKTSGREHSKTIRTEKAPCGSLLPRQHGFRRTENQLRSTSHTLHGVHPEKSGLGISGHIRRRRHLEHSTPLTSNSLYASREYVRKDVLFHPLDSISASCTSTNLLFFCKLVAFIEPADQFIIRHTSVKHHGIPAVLVHMPAWIVTIM